MSDNPLRIGLRFPRSQARILRHLIRRAESEGVAAHHISLFRHAEAAARNGEPLTIHCAAHEEAVAIADGFTMYGVTRPAIEDLTPRTA